MNAKSKHAANQFVYRQKIKNLGGIYVGVYIRGQAAKILKATKQATDKSYSAIITEALKLSLADAYCPALEPQTKAPAEYDWEDIK